MAERSAARPGGSGRISARRWERESHGAFQAWRLRDDGPAVHDLWTLCEAVSATVSSIVDPHRLAARLEDVMSRCDHLGFDNLDEVAAYTMLHMSDRYDRASQVLERLFGVGCLPIRREQLNILDVGSGPGPCLYAAIDFYQQLADWANQARELVVPTPVTGARVLDRGRAWGQLIHWLSEHLLEHRHPAEIDDTRSAPWPFGLQYNDFEGFSVHAQHHGARAGLADLIQADWEFDPDGDSVRSTPRARDAAYAGRVSEPSAYDIIFVSNFLTQAETVDRFRRELRGLAGSLSPGGLLVGLGAVGGRYEEIWERARVAVQRPNLVQVGEIGSILQAHPDPRRRSLILKQLIDDLGRVRDTGAPLPPQLRDLRYEEPFPEFRAIVWQNRSGPRRM